MTYYSGGYRWCDWSGNWHSGTPTNWTSCKYFQKCDQYGNWYNCPKPDGYVEGTSGDDVIDLAYKGDPEGDRIDNNDAILPGEGPNDDIVLAGDGNDIVRAGKNDDDIYGGKGDDTLYGEDGNDRIEGNDGKDTIYGGDGNDVIWGDNRYGGQDLFPDRVQDISNVVFYFDTNADGKIDYSVKVDCFPSSGSSKFISNDLDDYYGQLLNFIVAKSPALDGLDPVIGVSIKGGSVEPTYFYRVEGDTNGPVPDPGPTKNTGPGNNMVLQYDDFYKVYDPLQPPVGTGGFDDTLYGGDGDDVIYGQGGDDTITGGKGADQLFGGDDRDTIFGDKGDFVDGGAGGDDHDILDLTGKGLIRVINLTPDSNGNGWNGTVEFIEPNGVVTGTLDFLEIEEIRGSYYNASPDANDDSAETDEDVAVTINVLGNDTDPDSDPLTVVSATAAHGLVTINPNGTLTYTPDPDWNGTDEITYAISDGKGGTDTAKVIVTVNPVNDDPVAVDDVAATAYQTPVTIDVLFNDTDVDGDSLSIVGTPVALHGNVVVNPNGTLTYTPANGYSGPDTITYTITDGNGGFATAEVAVAVAAPLLDGIVEGTEGDDVIDVFYTGDPEGDRVDAGDAILPGAAPDDDVIEAYGGNDTVQAGAGNDVV